MSARGADVVVIGAGVAGLSAARRLAAGGAEVLVIEARDRVGGRTLSRKIGRAVFDLGGQWLGPTQKRMQALVAELGIETFPTHHAGRRVLEMNGRRSTYKGTIPSLSVPNLVVLHRTMSALERLRKQVPLETPADAAKAARWDGITVEAWKRRYLPFAAARDVFDAAVRTVFGAEPAELSLLHFLFYLNSGGGLESLVEVEGGAQETRFVLGAQEIALRLARPFGDRVVLSAPVLTIEHGQDGVTVRTAAGDFSGGHAVIAVPPALAGRIEYRPGLPVLRDGLTQRWPMGATTKVLCTYERSFWRDEGLSGEAISNDGPLTAAFDNTSHDGAQPALLGFLVGKHARTWAERPAPARRAAVLAHLARFFGAAAEQPIDYVEQDWAAEPFTRGCPVGSATPGTLTGFGATLRAPIGRLHFAGTETAREWNGYLEGAVESGERAADEIAARRPSTPVADSLRSG